MKPMMRRREFLLNSARCLRAGAVSVADHLPEPWPGLLSGGPNAHPSDPVAKTLPPRPPMRMYVDDQGAYSVNEVAINWNAPLVFLLAAANSV